MEHDDATSLGRCEEHAFERAEGTCSRCRYHFCAECLVHPRGDKRPPMCLQCALAASGVRAAAARAPRAVEEQAQHVMAGSVGVWVATGVATVGGVAALLLG